ncbi:MBL fold metallo-hydrolase [Sinimarinibacterium flocculans]|uniref:MBL fold metallo-hydrolase n=1 Tax=Sinimarinibacterium flocculans TaxID=985250 RepID=UPI00249396ED|nr:MBL fold metallo-hydrolase [Sinimarinibacterium flocculans]
MPDSAAPSHHTRRGFRNPHSNDAHGGWDALRWLPGFLLKPYRRPELPWRRPDPALLRTPTDTDRLTWIGHSSFLLQFAGRNLVTDPHLTARASPLRRAGPRRLNPPALDFPDLPPLDLALISHDHYDHLDEATVVRLSREHPSLHFVVPLGLKAWFARRGIVRVTELDWWQHTDIGGLRVHAVPAQHFSGRGARDRNATLWCGFVVESDGRRAYFAGDTGYSPDFAAIGARFAPVDLALIPIGAYAPRWFMQAMHIDPEEAVRIHRDIGSRFSVAMHWGTFRLTEEPIDEPPQRLRAALDAAGIAQDRFRVPAHGETLALEWTQ